MRASRGACTFSERGGLLFLLSTSPFLFHARQRPVVETQIKLSTGVKKRERERERRERKKVEEREMEEGE